MPEKKLCCDLKLSIKERKGYVMSHVNVLGVILLQKFTENQKDQNCQWSEVEASVTDKIVLLYIEF